MKTIHHQIPKQKCRDCAFKTDSFFCDLPNDAFEAFEAVKITTSYPKGANLFIEGQPSSGVALICQGRVKLSTNSRSGKALILRIAEPGELLGLSAALSDDLHEATAEAIEPCQINFVRRSDFVRLIKTSPEAGLNVIKQLNKKYRTAYGQIRSLGLSACVAEKLASLLLDWADSAPPANGDGIRLKIPFSHEEIAEMIGTTRETVTRMLKEFKTRKWITLKRSELHILDRTTLEASIGTRFKTNGNGKANGHL
jgi:CRP/FNR family transcriptional regulator